jgi:hypothetical protein
MNELTLMLSLMGADALSAIVLALMLFIALTMAVKSEFADEEVIWMGMLTINPVFAVSLGLLLLLLLVPLGECTISISAAAVAPLYVCNDGAYMRISVGMYLIPLNVMALELDALQLMDAWERFGAIVSAAPEHRLESYTQLNFIAMGFMAVFVGMSIGAVALHDEVIVYLVRSI